MRLQATGALFDVFHNDIPAVELHSLPGLGTFDCFEDRRHRGNAHEFTPPTGELVRRHCDHEVAAGQFDHSAFSNS